jgi:hypothetical protein
MAENDKYSNSSLWFSNFSAYTEEEVFLNVRVEKSG